MWQGIEGMIALFLGILVLGWLLANSWWIVPLAIIVLVGLGYLNYMYQEWQEEKERERLKKMRYGRWD